MPANTGAITPSKIIKEVNDQSDALADVPDLFKNKYAFTDLTIKTERKLRF
ncbi:MAG: hypothetical protein ACTHMI_09585 [Mucilaginibacter sp.]